VRWYLKVADWRGISLLLSTVGLAGRRGVGRTQRVGCFGSGIIEKNRGNEQRTGYHAAAGADRSVAGVNLERIEDIILQAGLRCFGQCN